MLHSLVGETSEHGKKKSSIAAWSAPLSLDLKPPWANDTKSMLLPASYRTVQSMKDIVVWLSFTTNGQTRPSYLYHCFAEYSIGAMDASLSKLSTVS